MLLGIAALIVGVIEGLRKLMLRSMRSTFFVVCIPLRNVCTGMVKLNLLSICTLPMMTLAVLSVVRLVGLMSWTLNR